jgi:aminoglycoside 2'-N-acetyltransferase I
VTVVESMLTADLGARERAALRALFDSTWSDPDDRFTDHDWEHAIGGIHFVIREGREPISQASVVVRRLFTAGHDLQTGYVEAVATRPDRQRRGHATVIMEEVGRHIRAHHPLGGLATGSGGFYERLGWRRWEGATSVRTRDGDSPTPMEDGAVFVLLTPSSPALDPTRPISCDWRPGDVW